MNARDELAPLHRAARRKRISEQSHLGVADRAGVRRPRAPDVAGDLAEVLTLEPIRRALATMFARGFSVGRTRSASAVEPEQRRALVTMLRAAGAREAFLGAELIVLVPRVTLEAVEQFSAVEDWLADNAPPVLLTVRTHHTPRPEEVVLIERDGGR